MKAKRSISGKILTTTIVIVMLLSVVLVTLMSRSMMSLTDTILSDVLPSMTKTASQSVEGNLITRTPTLFSKTFYYKNPAISIPCSLSFPILQFIVPKGLVEVIVLRYLLSATAPFGTSKSLICKMGKLEHAKKCMILNDLKSRT